jgi:cell division septation protein DedD
MPQDVSESDEPVSDYDDLDIPPSRFSMMTGTLVAIGLATLLIFSGVVWYAYKSGVDDAGQGALPVIEAEPGDVKVKPDDPGGANFAHQDKTVYDKIDGNEAGLEQLLPGSEEPREKPTVITPYNNELPTDGKPKVVRIPPPASGATATAPSTAPEVSAPEIPDPMGRNDTAAEPDEVVAAAPVPEVGTQTPDSGASAAPRQDAEQSEAAAPADPTPKDQAVAQSEVAKVATPAKPTDGKAFVLQLGAFRTREAADAGWKLLAARHSGVLGSLEYYVKEADLGEKGRFYRLQAGPFPERAVANTQCATLKAAGVDCLVAVR